MFSWDITSPLCLWDAKRRNQIDIRGFDLKSKWVTTSCVSNHLGREDRVEREHKPSTELTKNKFKGWVEKYKIRKKEKKYFAISWGEGHYFVLEAKGKRVMKK